MTSNASGVVAPASGTYFPPGTMTSIVTLFGCPPATLEVGEPPVLLLALRLELLELLPDLSLPTSSSTCLPASGGLAPASLPTP